jgi:hypothetical protein
MDGVCDPCKGEHSCTRDLEDITEIKRPIARPRRRWKNDIKLDVKEIDGRA